MKKKLIVSVLTLSMLSMTVTCCTYAAADSSVAAAEPTESTAVAVESESYTPKYFKIPEFDTSSPMYSVSTLAYGLDEHGNIVTDDQSNDRGWSSHKEYTNEYDEAGRIVTHTGEDATSTYEYDANGMCIKMTTTDTEGSVRTEEYAEYDANGNYHKKITTDAEGIVHEYQLEYDDKNRVISFIQDGLQQRAVYDDEDGVGFKVDVTGNISELMELDEKGQPVAEWINMSGFGVYATSVYDENGLKIQGTTISGTSDESQWNANVDILKGLVDVDA